MTCVGNIFQAITDSLSPNLVGLYLHGSLALDDFVDGKSDVDLWAVASRLRDDQWQRLIDAVSPETIPLEGGGFDIHVVTLDAARIAGWAPVREMRVANHPNREFHVEGRAADHDMCLTFEMCRRHGRALYDPDARGVFATNDRAALLAASKREIDEWLLRRDYVMGFRGIVGVSGVVERTRVEDLCWALGLVSKIPCRGTSACVSGR